jgi:hypothetical protein
LVKRLWIVIFPLLLAGCQNELDRAAKRYETAKDAHAVKEQCDTAEEAMDAALTLGKTDDYKTWKERATVDCAVARLTALAQSGSGEP